MTQDINARFSWLRGRIRKKLIKENFLEGKKEGEEKLDLAKIVFLAKYTYERSSDKVDQFMDWLREQEEQSILEVTRHPILPRGQEAWSDIYIRSSYQSGLAKARANVRSQGVDVPSFEHIPGGLAGVMNQPFHADRVGLVYTRSFNGMKGITEAMNSQLSRALAMGMAEGKGPYQIAIDMVGTKKRQGIVDNIGRNRARLIARTEIVQSHNEGALNEFESAESIIGEEILVQWWSALDERVRPKHDEHTGWHGMVMTRAQGRARLGEPNCRCSLLPWVISHQDTMPEKITAEARAVIGNKLEPIKKEKKLEEFKTVTPQIYDSFAKRTMKGLVYSETEEMAIGSYKGAGAFEINAKLRAGVRLTDLQTEHVNIMDKVAVKTELKENVLLYRGVKSDSISISEVGKTFVDKGFVSTTTNFNHSITYAQEFKGKGDIFAIKAKKGQNVIIPGNTAEWEVILPRNSVFKIESIREVKNKPYKRIILVSIEGD